MKLFRFAILLAIFASPAMACQSPAISDNTCGVAELRKADTSPQAIVSNPPAEYLACENDSECTLEKGICDQAMAVNTRYASRLREAAVTANKTINCIRAADPLSSYTATCKVGRCTRNPF